MSPPCHRKAIRSEIARYAERFREQQAAGLAKTLPGYGIEADTLSPIVLSVLLTSVSVVLVMEQALGMSLGHAEAIELVERYLSELEAFTSPSEAAPGVPRGLPRTGSSSGRR